MSTTYNGVIWDEITVDVSQPNEFAPRLVKQKDAYTRGYIITLTNNRERLTIPSANTTAWLNCRNQTDPTKRASAAGTINADGTVSVLVPTAVMDVAGFIQCDVSIITASGNDANILKSTLFYLNCEAAANPEGTSSTAEDSILARIAAGTLAPPGAIPQEDPELRAYICENQWDEQWEVGTLNTTTGQEDDTVTTKFRSKNFIPIIPGHQYRLVAPSAIVLYKYDATQTYLGNSTWNPGTRTFESNCYFAKIASSTSYGATYNGDISINHDASDTYYHPTVIGRHISKTPVENSTDLITSGAVYQVKEELLNAPVVLYVSSSSGGSDSNDGSYDHPLATVDRALEMGATKVMLFAGTYYQQIDLSKSRRGWIELAPVEKDKRVVFKDSDFRICSSATKYQDNDNDDDKKTIYKSSSTVFSDLTSADLNNLKWIYQDSVSDKATEITDAERHPLQRGYTYRCEDTLIKRCDAATLSDALSEIEDDTDYKWFYDSSESKIYFSCPGYGTGDNYTAVDSGHSIACGKKKNLFLNADRSKTVVMSGIIVKYMCLNVDNTTNSVLSKCRVYNAFNGGGFTWSNALNVTIKGCEAAHTQSGAVGDGFNAHSVVTNNPFAYHTTATMIDCWSHDNYDDGYSDHERCEISIFGGLFEYNGKAGVTPSYGTHCCCYNVLSRKNYNGFFYTAVTDSSEGGKYGQLLCVNCVSQNNSSPYATDDDNSPKKYESSGFRCDGAGNKLILINCKSIGNKFGYCIVGNTSGDLYDCSASGNTSAAKIGGGTYNIYSCTPLTAPTV